MVLILHRRQPNLNCLWLASDAVNLATLQQTVQQTNTIQMPENDEQMLAQTGVLLPLMKME
jgi:hypothetical protein